MPKEKGRHLTFDDRCEIEEMLKAGDSFRAIARRLNVSPTTVSNEVKANRTFGKPSPLSEKADLYRLFGHAGSGRMAVAAAPM